MATLFPYEPDWTEPVEETIEFLTDVLEGYAGLEQRIQLRQSPRIGLKCQLFATEPAEASAIDSKLWQLSDQAAQVPFWPDASPLRSAASPTDTFLDCETATRQFLAGGLALLWRDAKTFEVVTIDSFDASGLTLAAGISGTWLADGRSYVLPLLEGFLQDAPEIVRPTSHLASLALELSTEGLAFVEPAWAETYRDFDLLVDEPDRGGELTTKQDRRLHRLDPGTGSMAVWDFPGIPFPQRPNLSLLLEDRAAIERMRGFLLRRRGRLRPFWWPTWNRDLQMSANLAANETEISIEAIGYAAGPFLNPARRHLAFIRAGAVDCREVLAAEAGPDNTEILTLDEGISELLSKEQTLISYVPFVRLADDAVTLTWRSHDVAEIALGTVELAFEFEEVGS